METGERGGGGGEKVEGGEREGGRGGEGGGERRGREREKGENVREESRGGPSSDSLPLCSAGSPCVTIAITTLPGNNVPVEHPS